jgi:hypothetical protein
LAALGSTSNINQEVFKMAEEFVSKTLDLSVMSKDKFCVLPGQPWIRCATTEGGHTVVIAPAGFKNAKGEVISPREIPQIFVNEALGKGAITETMLSRIQAGIGDDDTPKKPVLSLVPTSTPDMSAEERFGKIKQALLPILIAGKPEDFTQQGMPQVAAISASAGFDVTGAERDAAFSELKDSPEIQALKK